MDESGIDMGFDLTAAFAVADPIAHHVSVADYDDEFEQVLSLLSTSTKELMYYELKSRAPDTGRYVNSGADGISKEISFDQTHVNEITRRVLFSSTSDLLGFTMKLPRISTSTVSESLLEVFKLHPKVLAPNQVHSR
ncbi:hypothetical protein ALC56_10743 [Trachymyrmex septentrionalis]|uniref:Uncharacterized protein n=1 Tax=Trachymyrmex septentrionalis TaxID=34720 RepID=A0A195F2G7_9HYME|nr:hypothetical protein ALC56_10743 [Trachymyrmex septentrionalis]